MRTTHLQTRPARAADSGLQRIGKAGMNVMATPNGVQIMAVGLNSRADKAGFEQGFGVIGIETERPPPGQGMAVGARAGGAEGNYPASAPPRGRGGAETGLDHFGQITSPKRFHSVPSNFASCSHWIGA